MEINYGIIEGRRASDYLGGTLPYEERNPSGDWTSYLPLGEWQANNFFDTFACVTFSALNSLETQYKFLTGQSRNFSDRFTARMSDTIPTVGNTLWRVGDSVRGDGIVDEAVWPSPDNYTEVTYYSPIPQEVKEKGKEFLKDWSVAYEWVDTDKASLIKHLKHSPLQAVIPGHAVLNFFTTQDIINYFDSYEPFLKQVNNITWAFKYVLTPIKKTMTQEEVKKQYALAFYRAPDAGELAYWTGRNLLEFLNTAIKDRAQFLNNQ